MRRLAWLHSTPDTVKGGERKSRFELLKGSPECELPPLDWGQHLVDALLEFGPSMPSANGPAPVTFSEIEAWARTTRTELPGYEALLLRQLSRDYCAEYHASNDSSRPMPGDDIDSARRRVANGLATLMKTAEDDKDGKRNPRRSRRR